MGQYKVPQNVEAEDKILGPLTFRQFIYALMGFGWSIICFALFFKTLPALFVVVGLPPTTLLLLLAFFNRDGQDFEHILIALIQFFAASRKRVWNKEDLAETFHIEPTKVVAEITQRNPDEVRSELEKVANLIDSRGWNQPQTPETSQFLPTTPHEDRLITPEVTATVAEDNQADIMDLKNSPLAQNLADLLQNAATDVREEAVEHMSETNDRLSSRIEPQPQISSSATLNPVGAKIPTPQVTTNVTGAPADDILKLATQNDDLSVSQLAAQATRLTPIQEGQTVDIHSNGS